MKQQKTQILTEEKKNQLARVLASAINQRDKKNYKKAIKIFREQIMDKFGGNSSFNFTGISYNLDNFIYNIDLSKKSLFNSEKVSFDSKKSSNWDYLTSDGKKFCGFIDKVLRKYLPNQKTIELGRPKRFGNLLFIKKYIGLESNQSYSGEIDILKKEKTADGKSYVTESAVRKKINEFEEFYNVCQKLGNTFNDVNKLEKSLKKIEDFENKEIGKIMGNTNSLYNKILRRNKK